MPTPSLAPDAASPSIPARPARALPAAPRISIADRVARSFPPLSCVRGFRYFTRGKVTLSSVSAAGLESDVKGKRSHHVVLRVTDGRLAAGCTCSAKVLGPASCRHVWATLLEADRQGVLASLRTTPRALGLVPCQPRGPARSRSKASGA